MDCRVRRMTIEDVSAVHAMDVASFRLPWPESAYTFETTKNPDSLPLVIELMDEKQTPVLAGILVIWLILDEAHVGTIATGSQYRRLGLARKLLAEGLIKSYDKGARSAFLEVRRSNLGAQELYKKFGFTIDGVRQRYYKDNQEDALLLSLKPLDREHLLTLASL